MSPWSHIRQMKLRGWVEFFDLQRFSLPDAEGLEERMATNLVYYQFNYVAFCALFMVYVVISRPMFGLIGLMDAVAVFFLWRYLYEINTAPILVAGRVITRPQIFFGVFCVVLYTLAATGGLPFFIALCLSVVVIMAHSAFRMRSLKARGTKFVDLWRGNSTPMGEAFKKEEDIEAIGEEMSPLNARRKAQSQARSQQLRDEMRAKYLPKKKEVRED